jgi:type I restriction enzyme S subunit
MKWTKQPLNKVADLCLGKMLDEKKNKGQPLPYLANINVRWGTFDLDNLREMRFEENELERYGLKYGDIVMCEGGEPGRCAIWKEAMPGMMIQKAIHRIRPHENLDFRYLYYDFLHKGRTGEFASMFTGATIKHLPGQNLAKIEIAIPPLDIQRRIADILSAYDDLIENNRRRIDLLEQSARMLYKEWFVTLRFPGHEHVKVKDGVPQGWEKKLIGDVCQTIGGGTPSTQKREFWDDGNIIWVTPTDVTRNDCLALLDSEKKITEDGLRNSSAKLLPPDTILMTSRASIGFFAMMDKEASTNQGFISIIPNESVLKMYMLHNLIFRVEEIRSNAGGTTFKEITKTRFRAMSITIPPKHLLEQFEENVYAILQQTRILKKQIKGLQQARDLLLPRLMNGEIPV